MCSLKSSFDDAILNLLCLKPNIIFLTGKTCNGKSYFSNILKNKGNYKILELDILVRELGEKHNFGTYPNYNKAFKVYKNQAPAALTREFVKLIRQFIVKNEYVIIEGALNAVPLINKIFRNFTYTFIYLYPWFVKNYYSRIAKRIQNDIDLNIRTVSFWNNIPENILNKLLKHGLNEPLLKNIYGK